MRNLLFGLSLCAMLGLVSCSVETDMTTGEKISWAKRTDFKLNFNSTTDNIETIQISDKALMEIILYSAETGEVPAYDYYDYSLLSKDEVQEFFHRIDTISIIDPSSEEEEIRVVSSPIDRSKFTKLRVKQEWYFDEANFKMNTKILAVAPMEEYYVNGETYLGDIPLFWVYLDGVVPESIAVEEEE